MTHRTSAPMKARKDIGEVVFPIEKLMAARAASSSWMGLSAHVVHLLIGDVDLLVSRSCSSHRRWTTGSRLLPRRKLKSVIDPP